MRKFMAIMAAAAALCSCNAISSLIHDDQVVAKVGGEKLYRSELDRFIPELTAPEDSVRLARQYINSWAMDRLYAKVAEEQLSKAEIDVSAELEAYRMALVKYRYEQRYISDRLDTVITDTQIKKYYEEHKADFELQRPVLKVRFVDVMKDSPAKDQLLSLMVSDDDADIHAADTLARASALRYFDNSDTWMDAGDLARAFGVDYRDMMAQMKGSMIRIEPEGRGDLLAAYVFDMQSSGTAPIEYCTPVIRDVILSGRKRELVKGLEQDLLTGALDTRNFVIY